MAELQQNNDNHMPVPGSVGPHIARIPDTMIWFVSAISRSATVAATAVIRVALLAMMMTGFSPSLRAQGACDCSCDAYKHMLGVMEQARVAMETGDYGAIPPEAQQLGACAGLCAMQWAQCSNPDAGKALQQAERVTAQPRAKSAEKDVGLPKERLTAAYLEGRWCSVYGGQETTQWRFDAAGEYRFGLPGDGGYAMRASAKPLEHFLGRFERLIEVAADAFTTEHAAGRQNVFRRGPC